LYKKLLEQLQTSDINYTKNHLSPKNVFTEEFLFTD